jgi:hypothetical protein
VVAAGVAGVVIHLGTATSDPQVAAVVVVPQVVVVVPQVVVAAVAAVEARMKKKDMELRAITSSERDRMVLFMVPR